MHPRGLNPGGIGFSCGKRCPRGASPLAGRGEGWRCGARMGACPGGRPPTLPCRNPAGAYLFGRLPTFCFSLLSFPHPPDPLPGGKGGTKGYFMQGASPLASPALNRLRHLQTLPFRYPGASLPWNRARACVHENNREKFLGVWGLLSRSPQRFSAPRVQPMPHGYKPDSKPTAEAAKPILQNPKSQPPSDTARKPQVRAPT